MRRAEATARVMRARTELGPLPRQIAALEGMTMRELRHRWAEVFGYATASHNHAYLRKKIRLASPGACRGGPFSARARAH